MHDRGYLALWRKIQDHPFYKERREFSKLEAWIDILMEVQHDEEPKKVIMGMTVITCNYGESLNSIFTWAKRWRWHESKVRRFFKLLSNMNQISTKSEGKTTRLTVLNYRKYDPRATSKPTNTRRAFDEHSTTDNNDKNDKNINISSKEDISFPKVSGNPSCPHKKIRNLYNETLGNILPQCKSTNSTFESLLKSRWREDKERQSMQWWEDYFKYISESDFLMGRTDNPFRASFEWIIRPTNMSKILNGNYNNRPHQEESLEEYAKRRGLA